MRRLRRPLAAAVLGLVLVVSGTPGPAGVGEVRASGGAFYIDSEPGDPLGDGRSVIVMAGGGAFGGSIVSTSASGPGGEGWAFTFEAPIGQVLTAGTTYATDPAGPTATAGSLEIAHWGQGLEPCSPLPGEFTIHEPALAVSFVYSCAGYSGSLYGELRIMAETHIRALSTSTSVAEFPDTAAGSTAGPISIQVASIGSAATTIGALSIAGPGADDFAITTENCTAAPLPPDSTCDVAVTFSPSVGGSTDAWLIIDDDTYRGSRTVELTGTGIAPDSAVAWGSARAAGGNYSWNSGASLARTTSATKSYLHTTAVTDRVGGTWVRDVGPYLGVMYSRGNSTGSSWSTPVRLNPKTHHGGRPSIAASGRYVYATWVRMAKVVRYSPKAPRTLYFRRNTSHGSGTWGSVVRLTSTTGRVDWPTLAASGASVYIAYTDSVTGSVKIAISRDRGATWRKLSLGATTNASSDGREGLPTVSASGNLVSVAWLANGAGAIVTRLSTDGGRTWAAARTLAEESDGTVTIAARAGRAAVAWTGPSGPVVRLWSGGAWGAEQRVGIPYGLGRAYDAHWSPAIALGASGQVGVAWSACWASCNASDSTIRADLAWAESADNGASWYRSRIVADASSSSARRVNDWPSVVWPDAGRRVILYNAWTPGTSSYRLYVRSGTGLP